MKILLRTLFPTHVVIEINGEILRRVDLNALKLAHQARLIGRLPSLDKLLNQVIKFF